MVCLSCKGIKNCLPDCLNKYHITPEVEYGSSPFLLIDLPKEYERKMPKLTHSNLLSLNPSQEPPHLDSNFPPGFFQQLTTNPLAHTQNPLPLTNQTNEPNVEWLTDRFLTNNDFRYNGNEEAMLDDFLGEHGDMDIDFRADTGDIENRLHFTLNESIHNILLDDIPVIDNEFCTMYEYDIDASELFPHIEMYK